MSRPPYLRWATAGLVIVLALYTELAPDPTVPHPFAAVAIPAGSEVTDAEVTWRDVPSGLLPPVSLPLVTGRPLAVDEPVLPSAAAAGPAVPEGWWAIELPVPTGTALGVEVRIVVGDLVVPGIVVGAPENDGFSEALALVAVPGEEAAAVAAAASESRAVVMVGGT